MLAWKGKVGAAEAVGTRGLRWDTGRTGGAALGVPPELLH